MIDLGLPLCGCLFVVSLSVITTNDPQRAVLLENLHMRRQWHPGSVSPPPLPPRKKETGYKARSDLTTDEWLAIHGRSCWGVNQVSVKQRWGYYPVEYRAVWQLTFNNAMLMSWLSENGGLVSTGMGLSKFSFNQSISIFTSWLLLNWNWECANLQASKGNIGLTRAKSATFHVNHNFI